MSGKVEAEWFFARQGQQHGPFTLAVMQSMIAAGQVNDRDLAWCEGMPAWTPVGQLPLLNPPPAASNQAYAPGQSSYAPQQGYVPQYASPPSSAAALTGSGSGQSQQGLAVAGFVMSVIPIFPMPLLGLIFSVIALKAMKKQGNDEGKGLATAGAIVGGILTGLACAGILVWVILIATVIGGAAVGH